MTRKKSTRDAVELIRRLENDEDEVQSLGMICRVAVALGKRVEIRILPAKRRSRSA